MHTTKSIAIVIPLYTTNLNDYEIQSFIQCAKILHKYDIYIVCPQSLDTTQLPLNLRNINVSYFDDFFFKGIAGYNKFMLSPDLYVRFINYKYILYIS